MKKPSLIIVGASGHGRVLADVFAAMGGEVLGYVDDGMRVGAPISGHEVLGGCDDLSALLLRHPECVVAVGIGDNNTRKKCVARVRAACPGVNFAVLVHPSAVISGGVMLGVGSVVLAGAVVGAGAEVGEFAIINTLASLDHHSSLGDFASLAPGVTTGGAVKIGAGAAIGIGACVLQGRTVGEDTVVGAMSLVYGDIPSRVVVVGIPARVTGPRDFSKPYLSGPQPGN